MNITARWNPRLWLREGWHRWHRWMNRLTLSEDKALKKHLSEIQRERLASLPHHLREIVLNANAKSRQAHQRRKENQRQAHGTRSLPQGG